MSTKKTEGQEQIEAEELEKKWLAEDAALAYFKRKQSGETPPCPTPTDEQLAQYEEAAREAQIKRGERNMKMHLYELSEAYQRLVDLEDEDYAQSLADIHEAFEEKAENICKAIKDLEGEAAGYSLEWDRLGKRMAALGERKVNLIAYLKANMEATGIEKIKGQLFTISLQNNSMPSCEVVNEEAIPWSFKEKVETVKVDRKQIIEWWKKGNGIPGVLIVQGKHIRIK